MLKGPTKSLKRHYAPRAGPACRHWLKQLPGHLKSCKMIEILEKQAAMPAGSHASNAVLIGTTGPSHREAWIRLDSPLSCDGIFVEKILQPANLQNSLSLLSPTTGNFTKYHHFQSSWQGSNFSQSDFMCHFKQGSRYDLVSSSASFFSNPLSSNSRSSKSSCVGTSTCASLKKIPEIVLFGYYPLVRTLECKFPCYEKGMADDIW